MLPLMMMQDFKPKGWLGLILGTRVWCKFDDLPFEPCDKPWLRSDPL